MSIDRMGNELAGLGVSGRDARCLLLLPQIYVGWALEQRDVAALEALLDTTARRARLGADALALARGWLFERPSRGQFQSGFALLRALRRAPERSSIASSDLLEAMLWACRAAQLERRRPDPSTFCDALPRPVARALSELEGWLEIDAGELWEDLLSADAAEPRAPSSWAAARFEALSDAELERATAPLEAPADDEPSLVRLRAHDARRWDDAPAPSDDGSGRHDDGPAPASAPFPLLRRLA
jgi:hypothetical protein